MDRRVIPIFVIIITTLSFLSYGVYSLNNSSMIFFGGVNQSILRKANFVDIVLCKLGWEKCIPHLKVYSLEPVGITENANKTVYKYLGRYNVEWYVLPNNVQSSYAASMADVNLAVYPYEDFIGGTAGHFYLRIPHPDYYSSDQKPNDLTITFVSQNIYGKDLSLSKIELLFATSETTSGEVDIILDHPYTWRANSFLHLDVSFDLPYDSLCKVVEKAYVDAGEAESYLYSIQFKVSDGSDVFWIVCSSDVPSSHCRVDKTATTTVWGSSHTTFPAGFFDASNSEWLGDGYTVIKSDANLVRSASSCGSNSVAYDRDGNGVAECYSCPPHSHNPGRIISGNTPYCVCDSGYYNYDHPVNGDTSLTPLTDSNGCESQPSCEVSVSISPSSRTIRPGESTTYDVYVNNQGTVTCTYSLSYSCPSGVSCSLSKNSVTVSPSSTESVTLTARSSSKGTYTLAVSATSTSPMSGYSDSDTATLYVQEENSCAVELSASPTTQTVTVGGTASYTIYVKNVGNTYCTYTLSADCPSGVNCRLSSNKVSVRAGDTSSVSLEATPSKEGDFSLKVTANAQSYGGSDSVTVSLHAVSSGGESIILPAISANTTYVKTYVGNTTTILLTVKNNGNAEGDIKVYANCPSGIVCVLSASKVHLKPGESTNVYFYATPQIAAKFTIPVVAEADNRTSYTNIIIEAVLPQNQTNYTTNPITLTLIPSSVTMNYHSSYNVKVVVKNNMKSSVMVHLSVECPSDLLDCSLDKTILKLNPGAQEEATLTLYSKNIGEGTVVVVAKDGGTTYKVLNVKVVSPGQQSIIPININIEELMNYIQQNPTLLVIVSLIFLMLAVIYRYRSS